MSFKMKTLTFSLCAALISGCAEKSQNIQGSYISPLQFQNYSCRQLGEEAGRISSRAAQVAGVQDKNAQNDAVAVGVSMVIFWPALFFLKGNKESKAELSRLRGEMEAIEKVSIKKNCGIKFSSPSSAEEK